MKIRTVLACFCVASLFLDSCIVSKKKYEEAAKNASDEHAENGRLKNHIAGLDDKLSKQSAYINQLKTNIESQKGTIAALSRRVDGLTDSLNNREGEISRLKENLNKLGDEKKSTAKELNATKEQIAEQRKSMEELEAKRRKMEDDLVAQRTKLEDQIEEQKKQLAQLQSFIDKQQKATEDLRKKMADALEGFNSNELTVTRKNGKVYISMQEGLLFPSGSAVVNKKGKEALAKVASVLNTNADINIDVEGHTDSVAIHNKTYADNWALSTARATAIAHVLIDEYDVSPYKLVASGRSKYDPVSPNTTQEGRAANRRTEIILEPKLDELMDLLNGK